MKHSRQGLAWTQEQGERRRLSVIAAIIFPVFLVMAVYITWVKLPEPKREEQEALPPQLARLVLEKKVPPKPVVEKREEPKPEPKVAEKPEPKPKPQQEKPKPEPRIVEAPKPKLVPKPQEIKQAREKVKKTGILAMSNELSELSALASSVQLNTPKTVTAKPIARKSADTLAAKASTGRSAGVDTAQLNQATQKVALAERARAKVEHEEQVVAAVETERQATRSREAKRSQEEVRRTMDANKAAIHSIYTRALRTQPALRGSVTPELVIENNGTVSSCSIAESTLNEPMLEQRICNRLRLVNFGAAAGVTQTTIRYPIELLPG